MKESIFRRLRARFRKHNYEIHKLKRQIQVLERENQELSNRLHSVVDFSIDRQVLDHDRLRFSVIVDRRQIHLCTDEAFYKEILAQFVATIKRNGNFL